MIHCCKDCAARVIGCHGICPKYIKEKEEHARLREKARLEKEYDSFLIHNNILKRTAFLKKYNHKGEFL